MLNAVARFILRQWPCGATNCFQLLSCAVIERIEFGFDDRMAAEDDLEQFLLRGLKLEKRSNFLQKLDSQHLRFVDDEDRETSFAADFQEHFEQRFEARLAALR